MIEIVVSAIPLGLKSKSEILYTMIMTNDLTGSPKSGNYLVHIQNGKGEELWRGRVLRHRRKQGVLKLVDLAISQFEKEGGNTRKPQQHQHSRMHERMRFNYVVPTARR